MTDLAKIVDDLSGLTVLQAAELAGNGRERELLLARARSL